MSNTKVSESKNKKDIWKFHSHNDCHFSQGQWIYFHGRAEKLTKPIITDFFYLTDCLSFSNLYQSDKIRSSMWIFMHISRKYQPHQTDCVVRINDIKRPRTDKTGLSCDTKVTQCPANIMNATVFHKNNCLIYSKYSWMVIKYRYDYTH